jgi:hypothetical protein
MGEPSNKKNHISFLKTYILLGYNHSYLVKSGLLMNVSKQIIKVVHVSMTELLNTLIYVIKAEIWTQTPHLIKVIHMSMTLFSLFFLLFIIINNK